MFINYGDIITNMRKDALMDIEQLVNGHAVEALHAFDVVVAFADELARLYNKLDGEGRGLLPKDIGDFVRYHAGSLSGVRGDEQSGLYAVVLAAQKEG